MYCLNMWVRKIGKTGNSKIVTIPPVILKSLGWERGDYVVVQLNASDSILLTRFDPLRRPDLLVAERESEAGEKEEKRVIKV